VLGVVCTCKQIKGWVRNVDLAEHFLDSLNLWDWVHRSHSETYYILIINLTSCQSERPKSYFTSISTFCRLFQPFGSLNGIASPWRMPLKEGLKKGYCLLGCDIAPSVLRVEDIFVTIYQTAV
jgi:hypothetical protein